MRKAKPKPRQGALFQHNTTPFKARAIKSKRLYSRKRKHKGGTP